MASLIHDAISNAETWEQFRRLMPRKEYAEILRIAFDDNGEEKPKGKVRSLGNRCLVGRTATTRYGCSKKWDTSFRWKF